MSKQEIEEEKMSKTQNGVIISVYVESPKIRSPQRTRTVAIKKSTNKPKSSSSSPSSVSKKPQIAARKKGFDRRAQLLAYARELRNAGSQEAQRPRKNLRPKLKTPKNPEAMSPQTRSSDTKPNSGVKSFTLSMICQ
ncbi:hypothetical protein SO802_023228 [Lithocarpus litseifolius]|uniref:Uncharacterized protein n=1 Tax=Lithocarpus litseifolius TaxID=425828 RepID=A0AAW2CB65_9ROSI